MGHGQNVEQSKSYQIDNRSPDHDLISANDGGNPRLSNNSRWNDLLFELRRGAEDVGEADRAHVKTKIGQSDDAVLAKANADLGRAVKRSQRNTTHARAR